MLVVAVQAQVADAGQGLRGEGLVDFHALDVAERPASAIQGLPNRGNRPETEQAGFDRADPEGAEEDAVDQRPSPQEIACNQGHQRGRRAG